jgi:hypothetical protein
MQELSEKRKEKWTLQACSMLEGFADYVKNQSNYDVLNYQDRIVSDMESINTNMIQLMMIKYMDCLDKNRVESPELAWPSLKSHLDEHRKSHGAVMS